MRYATVVLAALALLAAACEEGTQSERREGSTPRQPAATATARSVDAAPEPVGPVPEGMLLAQRVRPDGGTAAFGFSSKGDVLELGANVSGLVSPDQTRMAVARQGGVNLPPKARPPQVRILAADGRELFRDERPEAALVGEPPFPALLWSRDGSKLAYTLPDPSQPYRSQVYEVNADGSGRRQITGEPGGYGLVGWTGDGRLLVSEWSIEGQTRLRVATDEQMQELPLPEGAAQLGAFPQLSPDGRYAAMYGGSWEKMELWVLDLATGQLRKVAEMGRTARRPGSGLYVSAGLPVRIEAGDQSDPLLKGPPPLVWSPDGARIAYTRSWTDESGAFSSELRVADLVSGQDVALVDDQNQWLAAWSPNGKYLATTVGGYVVLLGDGSGRKTDVPAESLLWSRDGRLIASYEGGIRLIDPESGEVLEVLTPQGEKVYGAQIFGGETTWSPSGRYLAFGSTAGALYVLDVETATASLLLEDGGNYWPLGWLAGASGA